ncbi:MAG TPA: glycosyltransferase family 2 protein [Planctomycetota bacterium]|nr:glycosyltransferase family 2 protein [Planctomycetota bacterium]OQC20649.1 MAG: Undecaprenyl-phosphate mannosyltransferase [Planctomycetes bacterium ADurb.Bin069]NMD34722.1 glycosyltransferase family 2 protein [Planctomycetota bacterium]HNR98773.1 glycosyltransferase family 2 protein [Planctomycetota bacterium]HNU25481.1 glycosyltransferase family 2 protein [Planctomycetota bacterium]
MAETCIVIPTYNNARTLAEVVRGAAVHGRPIIVVIDGATDDTRGVLAEFPGIDVIDFAVNRGKGFALQAGFRAAAGRGWARAVTIDSDLQHDPAEIPKFLAAAASEPRALVVGVRDMKAAGAPRANRAGFALSNLYLRLLSGARVCDSQSGFRSYPVAEVLDLACAPSRFEYEFVVLAAAARRGIPIVEVPIAVRYDPAIYVTHFRKYRDFMRIFRAGLALRRESGPRACGGG